MKKKSKIILFIVCLISLYAGLVYKSLTFPKSLSSYSQKVDVPKKEYGSTPIPIMKDFLKEEITQQGDNYEKDHTHDHKEGSKTLYEEIDDFFDKISSSSNYRDFMILSKKCNESIKVDIDRISKVLIPRIIKTINKPLETKLPSWEAMSKLPLEPNFRDSVNNWLCWAYVLENQGRNMESLLVAFGLFYAAKELEDSFFNPNSTKLKSKLSAISIKNKAATYLMHWCRIPRPGHSKKIKQLALKLKDIINSDYKLSEYVEITKKELKRVNLKFGEASGWYADLVVNSNTFQRMTDEIYDDIINHIDKFSVDSYNIVNDRIDWLRDDPENFLSDFFLNPFRYSCKFFLNAETLGWSYIKKCNEETLNYMALVVNALAINAYYSKYNKLPKSLEKLESWLGTELPKDIFTHDRFMYNPKFVDVLSSEGPKGYKGKFDLFTYYISFTFYPERIKINRLTK